MRETLQKMISWWYVCRSLEIITSALAITQFSSVDWELGTECLRVTNLHNGITHVVSENTRNFTEAYFLVVYVEDGQCHNQGVVIES